MKRKNIAYICLLCLLAAVIFPACAAKQQYNFSLKNTLSIFLLNNEKGYYFCVPIQYTGGYHIARFQFDNGDIRIGDYDIALKSGEINISVYLNEAANEDGDGAEGFNLIYLEENGKVSVSKMAEPLTIKNKSDHKVNHYYIFIEKYLTDSEMKNIANEHKGGNTASRMYIWYNLTIDNNEQNGSGITDDFELSDEPALDPAAFPPNLNFFKARTRMY